MLPLPDNPDQAVRTAADGLAALPWFAHALAALAMGLGLLLWLNGQRVMRPGFILLGCLAGAAAGNLVPVQVRFGLDPWVFIGAGALAGALIGWLAFRVLVANTLGLVLAVAVSLATAALVQAPATEQPTDTPGPGLVLTETPDDDAPDDAENAGAPRMPAGFDTSSLSRFFARMKADELKEWLEQMSRPRGDESEAEDDEEDPGSIADLTTDKSKRIARVFAGNLWESLYRFWNEDIGVRGRVALLLSLTLGYLLGLVLGLALPARAAAVTTALIGPAVWLPAGAYLIVALGLPLAERLPARPELWLLAWAGAALFGMLFQFVRGGGKKKKEA